MLDLVIRGGQVVTPEGVGTWDVGVEGERIVALGAPGTLPRESARAIDASGKLVIPGGIDPHVHTGWRRPERFTKGRCGHSERPRRVRLMGFGAS